MSERCFWRESIRDEIKKLGIHRNPATAIGWHCQCVNVLHLLCHQRQQLRKTDEKPRKPNENQRTPWGKQGSTENK